MLVTGSTISPVPQDTLVSWRLEPSDTSRAGVTEVVTHEIWVLGTELGLLDGQCSP